MDLLLCFDGLIGKLLPGAVRIGIEKSITDEDRSQIATAFTEDLQKDVLDAIEAGVLVVGVCVPDRYRVCAGSRGSRYSMTEAALVLGQLFQAIAAGDNDSHPFLSLDFIDNQLGECLNRASVDFAPLFAFGIRTSSA